MRMQVANIPVNVLQGTGEGRGKKSKDQGGEFSEVMALLFPYDLLVRQEGLAIHGEGKGFSIKQTQKGIIKQTQKGIIASTEAGGSKFANLPAVFQFPLAGKEGQQGKNFYVNTWQAAAVKGEAQAAQGEKRQQVFFDGEIQQGEKTLQQKLTDWTPLRKGELQERVSAAVQGQSHKGEDTPYQRPGIVNRREMRVVIQEFLPSDSGKQAEGENVRRKLESFAPIRMKREQLPGRQEAIQKPVSRIEKLQWTGSILQGKEEIPVEREHTQLEQQKTKEFIAPINWKENLHFAPQKGEAVPSAEALVRVEKADLIQEVAAQIVVRKDTGNSQFVVQLKPEELGKVQIKMELQDKDLTLRFVVENEGVRDFMLSQVHQLKEQLSTTGLDLKNCSVDVDTSPFNFFANSHSREQGTFQQQHNLPHSLGYTHFGENEEEQKVFARKEALNLGKSRINLLA